MTDSANGRDAASRRERLRDAAMSALVSARRGRALPDEIAGCHFVPGRVEVLGKHTDYAGGRSLLAAVAQGFVVVAARRRDETVRVIDGGTGASVEFDHAEAPRAEGFRRMVHARGGEPAWSTYPLAVLRRCARNFPLSTGGADIAFASDLPQAAGLSSSSALVVATFLALDAVRGISATREYTAAITSREDLAGYLGAVENGLGFGPLTGDTGVGTMGGSEDHTAILCARPGRLVQYSFAPVRYEADVPVPAGLVFVIASSGVRAEKAGPALKSYNRLSAASRRLVQLWKDAGAGEESTLAAIVAADGAGAQRLREIVHAAAASEADQLLARLAQFIAESEEIIPAARGALARGDLEAFGSIVQRSQHYAEHTLRNQIPETIHLASSALSLGATAASAFGAGFGGSVWALVRDADAQSFLKAWQSAYAERFGRQPLSDFFVTHAAAPAARLE